MRSSAFDLLGEQIAADAAHLDAAHHRVLANLRIFDEGGGWLKQGFRSCAQWLSWRVGWGFGTAREHVRVANALGKLPKIDDALRTGMLSFSKVRALTRVATPDNEHVLLEQALLTTGYQLEKLCAKYASVRAHGRDGRPIDDLDRRYVQRRERDDGMVVINAVLHPDEAATVWAALDRLAAERCRERVSAETSPTSQTSNTPDTNTPDTNTPDTNTPDTNTPDTNTPDTGASRGDGAGRRGASVDTRVEVPRRTGCGDVSAGPRSNPAPHSIDSLAAESRQTRGFCRADALVAMARAVVSGTRPDRTPTELVITLPVEALHGADDDPLHLACCADGTALAATTARRLTCDAGIVTVVEDKHGNPLAIGRKRRTISGALKRAMLRRDRTCRFPGCNTRAFLEGHHIKHWAHGGSTELSNVLAVCSFHHRFLHEYGFTIELLDDGTVVARNPHGAAVPEVPARLQLAGLGWPTIEQRNARFAITADTISTWDGTPADYVALVDAVLKADAYVERAAAPA